MGDRPHPAAVDEAQPRRAERGLLAQAIGPVAVQHDGRAAVARRRLQAQRRHRHLRAVTRLDEEALGHVARSIVARGHLLRLAQRALLRPDVVVDPLARRRRRLVHEAHHRGVELVAGGERQRVGRLVLLDQVFLAGAVADGDARQRVGALQADQVAPQGRQALDVAARLVRHDVLPVGAVRVAVVRLHDLEVDRAIRVRVHVPGAVEVDGCVELALLAGGEHPGCSGGLGGCDEVVLARLLVAHADEDEVAAGRRVDPQEHARVLLLVDHDIGAAAGGPTQHLHRALVVVLQCPEEVAAVRREHEAVRRVLDGLAHELARGEVLHQQPVDAGTLVVFGVGEEPVVGRVRGRADLVEGLAARQRLDVEQHLRRAAPAWRTGVHGMLGALQVTGEVRVRAVGNRHRVVVVLDAALHLLVNDFLERQRVRHQAVVIGVFAQQVLADVGTQHGGVAKDLLPVVVLQPLVLVVARAAQLRDRCRPLGGLRCSGHSRGGRVGRQGRGGAQGQAGGAARKELTAIDHGVAPCRSLRTRRMGQRM